MSALIGSVKNVVIGGVQKLMVAQEAMAALVAQEE